MDDEGPGLSLASAHMKPVSLHVVRWGLYYSES